MLLTLPVFFFACKNKEEGKKYVIDEKLIVSILEECVRQDSFKRDFSIIPKLKPYSLYYPLFTDDGLEIPPSPPDFKESFTSPEKLITEIEDSTLFILQNDSSFVKEQILYSKDLYSNFFISELISKKIDKDSINYDQLYLFYTPIFNKDSSAVYVKYDHYYYTFAQGVGLLLAKRNGKWILIKKNHTWMT